MMNFKGLKSLDNTISYLLKVKKFFIKNNINISDESYFEIVKKNLFMKNIKTNLSLWI